MHQHISRLLPALFGVLFVLGAAPYAAHAAVDVQVRQVLPPSTQQACPSLGVSDIHPYVYDGALHSFDISITDPSYVAIGGKVGDTVLGFRTMTRWHAADGTVRIHVDIESASVRHALLVSVTLLSAQPGGRNITCMAVVSGVVAAVPVPAHTPQGPAAQHGGSGTHVTTGAKAGSSTTETATLFPGPVTTMHALGDLCRMPSGSARLWIVLIVLYAFFALWSVIQATRPSDTKSVREWLSAAIAGIFLALLFFWYLSAQCRTGAWAPTLSTLIAVAALAVLAQPLGRGNRAPLLLNSAQEG